MERRKRNPLFPITERISPIKPPEKDEGESEIEERMHALKNKIQTEFRNAYMNDQEIDMLFENFQNKNPEELEIFFRQLTSRVDTEKISRSDALRIWIVEYLRLKNDLEGLRAMPKKPYKSSFYR